MAQPRQALCPAYPRDASARADSPGEPCPSAEEGAGPPAASRHFWEAAERRRRCSRGRLTTHRVSGEGRSERRPSQARWAARAPLPAASAMGARRTAAAGLLCLLWHLASSKHGQPSCHTDFETELVCRWEVDAITNCTTEFKLLYRAEYAKQSQECVSLRQDTAFLTSNGRLSEQLVDKIILQLNRVYPQILTIKEAEKFRNPKAPLHSRLSNLIAHLQKTGDKPCQEFYRALQINAEHLYNNLPSRRLLKTSDSTGINPEKEKCVLNDRGPTFFLACFSVAAGLAFYMYCCNPDSRVLGKAKKVLGFSPIIIGRHVRNICMLYMEDSSGRQ